MVKYYVHDREIIRLTSKYGIKATDVPVDGTKRDDCGDDLEQLLDRALVERDRGAVIDYWRAFGAKHSAGEVDYDVNGLFRPEFDITFDD